MRREYEVCGKKHVKFQSGPRRPHCGRDFLIKFLRNEELIMEVSGGRAF